MFTTWLGDAPVTNGPALFEWLSAGAHWPPPWPPTETLEPIALGPDCVVTPDPP